MKRNILSWSSVVGVDKSSVFWVVCAAFLVHFPALKWSCFPIVRPDQTDRDTMTEHRP